MDFNVQKVLVSSQREEKKKKQNETGKLSKTYFQKVSEEVFQPCKC